MLVFLPPFFLRVVTLILLLRFFLLFLPIRQGLVAIDSTRTKTSLCVIFVRGRKIVATAHEREHLRLLCNMSVRAVLMCLAEIMREMIFLMGEQDK